MDVDAQGGPPLLATRSRAAQLVLALVAPALFGGICGYILGLDKTAYQVLTALALIGGYLAGQEHRTSGPAALRGLLGGAVFGAAILAAHELLGATAKSQLPHPSILLIAIAAVIGATASALGGRRRARGIPGAHVDLRRLGRPELLGLAGAALLLGSLLMPWFSTACDSHGQPRGCNRNSTLHGLRGSFDALDSYHSLQWILLAIAATPLVAAYLLGVRGHAPRWRPGETAMIAGSSGIVLILTNGIILGRPGGDSIHNVGITLQQGYFLAVAGCLLIALAGAMRESVYLRSRRPTPLPKPSHPAASEVPPDRPSF